MRRRFNSSERVALYLVAGGKCASCGTELEPGWHADHVEPYSRGGETDVLNGQALCPGCNLVKGDKLTVDGVFGQVHSKYEAIANPWDRWQARCLDHYQSLQPGDFLLSVSPGGGKTRMALKIAIALLEAGIINKVIVLVPGIDLKLQWSEEANVLGLKLDEGHNNRHGSLLTVGMQGVIATYQQIIHASQQFRLMANGALVIFDEIHHSAEGLAWGNAVKEAFTGDHCKRLALTGTPIRNSNHPITFLWDDAGNGVSNFTYSRANAVADRVIAPITFRFFRGQATWLSRDGEWIKHDLKEAIDAREESRRYRAILAPGEKWLESMLREADKLLSWIRDTQQADAAAWVRCMSIDHARDVVKVLTAITGDDPVLLTSEEVNTAEKRAAFRDGVQRWLVAVDMVAEGTNIPRLWVGCHASLNRESFPDFVQESFRIVRNQEGIDGKTAYFLAPYDEQLMGHAESIMDEVQQGLNIAAEESVREAQESVERQMSLFLTGETSEAEHDTSIYDQDRYAADQVRRMEKVAYAHGALDPAEKLLQILADFKGEALFVQVSQAISGANTDESNSGQGSSKTPRQQITALKEKCNKALQDVMRAKIYELGMGDLTREEKRTLYRSANSLLNELTLVDRINAPECGLEKLQERLDIIIGWSNGTRSDFIL